MQIQAEHKLIEVIAPLIAPLGYEVVHVEVQTHRQKTLRLFIDFAHAARTVGIEDCVKVAKALDAPLEQNSEIDSIFHGPYELEVSSPGIERPLRQKKDYERFAGKSVRLHTFRALSPEETGNEAYSARNPKQKNFTGALKGLDGDRVLLAVETAEIRIPLGLISKANLAPVSELDNPTKQSPQDSVPRRRT